MSGETIREIRETAPGTPRPGAAAASRATRPVMFVGVRCPLAIVLERRHATWGAGNAADGQVPAPVLLWQQAVHLPGIYDLELDTSASSAEECAGLIRKHLETGSPPSAFQRLAAMATG